MLPLYVAVTAHGFGHITRTAAVVQTLLDLDAEVLPIFVTPAPQWLIDKYVSGHYLYRPRRLDIGVIQQDSLGMDLSRTQRDLEDLRLRSDVVIRSEVEFCRLNQVRLVFGDIPPLAVAIAHAAGIPCWMEGNFGWDFIYQDFGMAFEGSVAWIQSLYQHCDRLFQLPFHEPMTVFPHRETIGLTGGDPSLSAIDVRNKIGLDPNHAVTLLSFGGYGLNAFPYHRVADHPDHTFITLDASAPDLPNLIKLDGKIWRPVDLMPICQEVITKPGYSTLSEAMRIGIPITCITRDGFSEADLLLTGLRDHSFHKVVTADAFFGDDWDFCQQPYQAPLQSDPLPQNGNRVIAEAILNYLHSAS